MASLAGACASASDETDVEPQVQAQWGEGASATRSAAPFGCKGERIALETANGRNYLTAVVGGGFAMLANATKVGAAETFRVYDLGDDRVALQVSNGNYMVAANGGGLLLNANAGSINRNSTFKLGWTADGEWLFLRSASGHYVTAEGGGGNVANVGWPILGANQGFKTVCVEGSLDGSDPTGPSDPWGTGGDAWGDEGGTPPVETDPAKPRDPWGTGGDAWGGTGGEPGLGG